MSKVYRFGVSLEKHLIEKFDKHIKKQNYPNRSEAIRDLIRDELVKDQWLADDEEVAGAITMVYDHHKRELVNKLMTIQHDFVSTIISTQHIHLDHNNCLEIIAVKGAGKDVQKLASKLKAQKNVNHVTLNMSTTGKILQ